MLITQVLISLESPNHLDSVRMRDIFYLCLLCILLSHFDILCLRFSQSSFQVSNLSRHRFNFIKSNLEQFFENRVFVSYFILGMLVLTCKELAIQLSQSFLYFLISLQFILSLKVWIKLRTRSSFSFLPADLIEL